VIYRNKFTNETSLIAEFERSQFVFYLTGSRQFGTHTYDSDFDFFVGEQPNLDEFLLALGFELIPAEFTGYGDPLILRVYEHWNANVHVQVVTSAPQKLDAQELLDTLPRNVLLAMSQNKAIGRDMWQWAIKKVDK